MSKETHNQQWVIDFFWSVTLASYMRGISVFRIIQNTEHRTLYFLTGVSTVNM
jgi:hypothetical protein